jgi:ribosome-binding factor A
MSEYAHIIQKKLGTQLQTYKIPKVRFRYDDSGELGQSIQNTINALN